VVRIFTSSTFTDMLMERNTLMEYVYPKIKEYCREKHGLEYQVRQYRIFVCLFKAASVNAPSSMFPLLEF
jgi:hydroxylamine reductase (hybrid-cluster protein)